MRSFTVLLFASLSLTALAADYGTTTNPTPNMAHAHMEHVDKRWASTPDQQGFLTTAIAEASIAEQHSLAATQASNLAELKVHVRQVAQALSGESSGNGLGFGVVDAAKGAKKHIMLAAQSPGSSDAVQLHALHIGTSASNVALWAEQAIALTDNVAVMNDLSEARTKVNAIHDLVTAIVHGADADGDQVITWHRNEGGLAQAQWHMDLLNTAEGL